MTNFGIPKTILQLSAVASVLAGIFMIAGFALHPAGEDATFGTDPRWVPAHALLWIAYTISLVGWVGVYIVMASKAGKLGAAALAVILVGTSFSSWIFSSDVTFVPVIAKEAPELFPEIFRGGHIAIGIASVLTWVLGNVLFGSAIMRTMVFPRLAGILLIVGTVAIPVSYLSHLSIHFVAAGAFLAAAGQIWLGKWMFRIIKGTTAAAAA
jgi:hypothetical protein